MVSEPIVSSDSVAEIKVPSSNRKMKIRRSLSMEEIEERWSKGLCVFCAEPETSDHHLKHKNLGILMVDGDDDKFPEDKIEFKSEAGETDSLNHGELIEHGELISGDKDQTPNDKELVETEVATELTEVEDPLVQDEDKAKAISTIVKEELISQIQVPISKMEHGLRFYSSSLSGGEDLLFAYAMVGIEQLQSGFECVKGKNNAYHVFGKMLLRKCRLQERRKLSLSIKSWKFKYKEMKLLRLLPQHEHYNLRGGMIIKQLHETSYLYSGFNQEACIGLEMCGWDYKTRVSPYYTRLKNMCQLAELQGIKLQAFNVRVHRLLLGYLGFKVQLFSSFKNRYVWESTHALYQVMRSGFLTFRCYTWQSHRDGTMKLNTSKGGQDGSNPVNQDKQASEKMLSEPSVGNNLHENLANAMSLVEFLYLITPRYRTAPTTDCFQLSPETKKLQNEIVRALSLLYKAIFHELQVVSKLVIQVRTSNGLLLYLYSTQEDMKVYFSVWHCWRMKFKLCLSYLIVLLQRKVSNKGCFDCFQALVLVRVIELKREMQIVVRERSTSTAVMEIRVEEIIGSHVMMVFVFKQTRISYFQCVALHLFDPKLLRLQSKTRHKKCHKPWMFKYKFDEEDQGNLHYYASGRRQWILMLTISLGFAAYWTGPINCVQVHFSDYQNHEMDRTGVFMQTINAVFHLQRYPEISTKGDELVSAVIFSWLGAKLQVILEEARLQRGCSSFISFSVQTEAMRRGTAFEFARLLSQTQLSRLWGRMSKRQSLQDLQQFTLEERILVENTLLVKGVGTCLVELQQMAMVLNTHMLFGGASNRVWHHCKARSSQDFDSQVWDPGGSFTKIFDSNRSYNGVVSCRSSSMDSSTSEPCGQGSLRRRALM